MYKLSGGTGAESRINKAEIDGLRHRLHGDLVQSGDQDYDALRKVWNAIVDKRPALIVRCAGVADVIDAVTFAREFDLLVSVRCGGHNIAGTSVCDNGLMIDLSLMRSVHVDPVRQIARVEGGATLGRLDRETQAFGLATTAGVVTHTGVGGLTLGGGVGRLARKFGLACDNLISVDVVTADGRFLTASLSDNEDLFWGLRGGGGNFGIATSFEFRLHAIGTEVLRGAATYPIENAKEALQFFREYALNAPDEVTTAAAFLTADDGTPVLSLSACHIAPLAQAESVLWPLVNFASPMSAGIESVTYIKIQAEADEIFPYGQNYYWKTHFIKDLPDDAIDTLLSRFAVVPGPWSLLAFQQYGGAVGRIAPAETAFSHRDAQFDFLPVAIWHEPSEAKAHIEWARETWKAMEPFSTGGTYINDLGDEGEERVRAAVGQNYDRLVALKNKYDPTNFFRLNANIKPSVNA